MEAYCNSPIIISTMGYTPLEGVYFPRVVLRPNGEKHNELTAECSSVKEVRFDLSSYAKGKLYNMSISPSGSVPTANISYEIFQREYLAGSDSDVKRLDEGGTVTVYLGRGDALSLYKGIANTKMSYKPDDVEVVNEGDYYIPRNTTTSAIANTVSASNNDVYIESNPNRHQLIFLNSFGRWESASACTLDSKSYKYTSEDTEVDINFPDNVGKPSLITDRQLDEVTWSMSSGYCTQEWAEWWAKEVLAAEYVWIKEDNRLIRVILEPEDSATVYNKSKGNLSHVEFKVKFI